MEQNNNDLNKNETTINPSTTNEQPKVQALEEQTTATTPTVKKKSKLPIIIALILILAIGIGLVIFFLNREDDDDGGSRKKKEETSSSGLKAEYAFNKGKNNEKLSFIIKPYSGDERLFIGMNTGKGDNKLTFLDGWTKYNEVSISKYDQTETSIHMGEISLYFDQEAEAYKNENGNETYDNQTITYKDGNYFITPNNIGGYCAYYLFKTEDLSYTITWSTVQLGFFDTEDQAKEKINYLKENVALCSFKEGDTSCKDDNDKTIEFEDYTYYYNAVVNMLADNKLYLKSYKQVTEVKYEEISIIHNYDKNDEDKKNRFTIKPDDVYLEKADKDFTINGMKVKGYMSDYDFLYAYIDYNGDDHLQIRVSLDSGIEDTFENQEKALKDCFS